MDTKRTMENIYNEINIRNRKNLAAIIFIVTILDIIFYLFASFDNQYPSNPFLLKLMVINLVIDIIMFVILRTTAVSLGKGMTLVFPFIILGLKLIYGLAMPFDTVLVIYYISILLIINLAVRSKWDMLLIAIIYEFVYIYQLTCGYMDNTSLGYAIVIINGVVTISAGIISMYRYDDHMRILTSRNELIESKLIIEQYSRLKDVSLELNHKLTEYVEIHEYFNYVLQRLVDIVQAADAAAVLEVNDSMFEIISSVNYVLPDGGFHIPIGETFAYNAGMLNSGKPIILNDLLDLDAKKFESVLPCKSGGAIQSSLSSPLIMNGELYGLFNLDSTQNKVFTLDDVELMTYFSEQMSIVLEKHKLYNKITKLSQFDQLTGFRNRWYLNEIREQQVMFWKRGNLKVNLVLFDLDKLKVINDNYGHDMGDAYIIAFCQRLKGVFRKTDLFIRNGGDEFLGVFFDIPAEKLEEMLENLRLNIQLSIDSSKDFSVPVLFSYGIVNITETDFDFERALKLADNRMYDYKTKHRI